MTRNQKVLAYLKRHGSITVGEANDQLKIRHLPRRVMDLMEMGYQVKRKEHKVYSCESGRWITITVYSLPKPKRKIEQLNLNLN